VQAKSSDEAADGRVDSRPQLKSGRDVAKPVGGGRRST